MPITLTFCGAAGTVTGSCYWMRTGAAQFLIDCGLFQGSKSLKELNYSPLPFNPGDLSFVLLTHAHIDHAGLLPRLVRQGFQGPIYASASTIELLDFLLPDSASIHEMEVDRLNRRNLRRGRPQVTPIFSQRDVRETIAQLRPVDLERWTDPAVGVRARFWDAGHILGSTSIEIETGTNGQVGAALRLLFSGDIGPENKLFHTSPAGPAGLDYLVCEATYGNERRPPVTPQQRRLLLAAEVNRALERGGNLIIPTFAVERTQELLYDLCLLFDQGTVSSVPVFLDSPLAIKATEIFARNMERLDIQEAGRNPFHRANIHLTPSPDDSKGINRFRTGAIILAGSGMCEAGRIRFHLKENLWRSECTVLLAGYQATGTLGSLLAEGASTVRIQGEDIRVNAEIRRIDAYTGHADADGLAKWVENRMPVRKAVFLTHGEDAALQAMKHAVERIVGRAVPVVVPRLDDSFDLLRRKLMPARRAAPRRLEPRRVGALDWHNDLAALSIQIRDTLEALPDDDTRARFLKRIQRAVRR